MRIFTNPNYNFIKWRWHALVLSALVIGAGIATIIARGGLPLGVDFSGGTVMVLKFAQPTGKRRSGGRSARSRRTRWSRRVRSGGENEIMVRLPLRQGMEQGASLEAGRAGRQGGADQGRPPARVRAAPRSSGRSSARTSSARASSRR